MSLFLEVVNVIFGRKNHKTVLKSAFSHNRLCQSGRIGEVADTIAALKEVPLGTSPGTLALKADARDVATYIEGIYPWWRLTRSLSIYVDMGEGTIACPLPRAWIKTLEERGIRCQKKSCRILWWAFMSRIVFKLMVDYGGVLIEEVRANTPVDEIKEDNPEDVYLYGVVGEGLLGWEEKNSKGEVVESEDIMRWLQKRAKEEGREWHVGHNNGLAKVSRIEGIKTRYSRPPYRRIRGLDTIAVLCRHIASYALKYVRERSRFSASASILMMFEDYKLYAVSQTKEELPKEVIFSYFGSIYTPIWTKEVERRGTKCSLMWYSVSMEPAIDKMPRDTMRLRMSGWRSMYAWNDYHKAWLKSFVGNRCIIEVSDSVSLSDSLDFLEIPERSISVFDIPVQSRLNHLGISSYTEYLTEQYYKNFFDAIVASAEEMELTILIKPKRENRYIARWQKRLYRQLGKSTRIQIVPAGVSAKRVAKMSKIVVSMPFTSTAHYSGKEKSVYFDPDGALSSDEALGLGISIAKNRQELDRFIRSVDL